MKNQKIWNRSAKFCAQPSQRMLKANSSTHCVQMAKPSSHWLLLQVVIKCWVTSYLVLSPPPHRTRQKESGLHLWLFILISNHRESGHNSTEKDCVSAKNMDMIIVSCLAALNTIHALGSRRRVTSACRMNMEWMMSLCLSAFQSVSWRTA